MAPLSGGTSIWARDVAWRNRSNLDADVTIDGAWIVFRAPDDTVYVFDSAEHEPEVQYTPDGLRTSLLSEIRFRGGYSQALSYSGNYLTRVTDTFGRWLEFEYVQMPSVSRHVSRVRTSNGQVLRYSYQNRFPTLALDAPIDFWSLSTVVYPDMTADESDNPRVTYEYLDAVGKPGLLLSGIIDERGVRFASWTYDVKGRVLVSEHAGGTDRWQFSYDDAGGTVTVTNPLGRPTKYTYRKVFGGLRQLVSVDGVATSNCVASNTQYSYDANGFRARAVDAEGRVTTWERNTRGLPVTTTEGARSMAARTRTTTWDPIRPLPTEVAEPGLTSTFSYGATGHLQQTIETSTLKRTVPYATGGERRSTRYNYTSFRPAPVPPGAPSGDALADVALPLINPNASEVLAGWTSTLGGLGMEARGKCSSSNPCFFGGTSTWVIAHQDVSIPSEHVSEVDRGLRSATISWLQNARGVNDDYGGLGLLFLDAEGRTVGSSLADLQSVVGWKARQQTAPVPATTRVIRVQMLMWKVRSRYNDANIDDLALTLSADGAASKSPFLKLVNGSGIGGSVTGWTADSSDASGGPVGPVVATVSPPCPFCVYIRNENTQTGASKVRQRLAIPSDRYREVDAGHRGLELSLAAWVNQRGGKVEVSAEFFDASGKPLAPWAHHFSPAFFDHVFRDNVFRVPLLPKGTRFVDMAIATSFPVQATGPREARWSGASVRLVKASDPPSAAAELLSTIDGPLPGTSDTIRFAYDAMGNLASVTNELGHVTRIARLDASGRPASLIDPNGVTTTMAYDARGRLNVVTVNPGPYQARTIIAYDPIGQVRRVIAPDGSYLQFTWSDARRLVSVTNNAGERIDYGHNANGDVTSRTVKAGSSTIIRQQWALFDEIGRLMRSIGAAGQQTVYRYDRTDNLTAVRDPRGGIFAYAYDGLQNLARLTDQAGSSVTLTRDGQGEVTGYRDARGLTTTYLRNGFGEIIQESGPDVGTTVIVRDERGLPTRITDPRGIVTLLSYDAAGRLVKQAFPADRKQDITYVYDDTTNGNKGIGRLTGVIDASGAVSRYYDALGRVVAETRLIGGRTYSTAYAYNNAGRLTAITYPSGRVVSYMRNGLGRVTAVTTQASAAEAPVTVASGLSWSPMSSRLRGFTHGNGLAAARAYDTDGRLIALKLASGSTPLMDLSYAYADRMNLTAVKDNLTAAQSVSLGYDAAQRLASARGPWGQLAYSYTPNGDRAQEVLTPPGGGSALTTQLRYPASSNRLSSTTVGNLTTRSFAYDAAGNLVTQVMGPLRLSFTYNLRNRPVTVTRTGDGTQTSRYIFNALEQMVSRATNAPGGPAGVVHYIHGLDGALLAEAGGATGKTLRDYIWLPQGDASPAADNDNEEGGSPPPLPLALVSGAGTPAPELLMVHADHLGRPVRLTDATRATVWSASYDPFGQPVSVTGALEQNLRFPGQYFLLETGLSYNWHRFYDPATGRYTQPDPLRFVDGPSVYSYAKSSPLSLIDALGLLSGSGDGLPRSTPPGSGGGQICFEDCEAERRACNALCRTAKNDPDMPNIWFGSYGKCMRGCVSQNCGGNKV